jgi:hypothetical protein
MAQAEGAATTIRERLGWEVTPEMYARIRGLWIAHSKAEDGRDVDGLIATLSEECVYELPRRFSGRSVRPQGHRHRSPGRNRDRDHARHAARSVAGSGGDPRTNRFAGERIYYDSGALTRQLAEVKG